MATIVFIILQIFFATCAVLKSGECSRIFPSFSWGIFGHVTSLGHLRASEKIWWIIISIFVLGQYLFPSILGTENILASFRAKWRLLYIYVSAKWRVFFYIAKSSKNWSIRWKLKGQNGQKISHFVSLIPPSPLSPHTLIQIGLKISSSYPFSLFLGQFEVTLSRFHFLRVNTGAGINEIVRMHNDLMCADVR